MIIKVEKIRIYFDEKIEAQIEPKYLGKPRDIEKVKQILGYSRGMYGHILNPDNCLAVDLLHAIKSKFPKTQIPEYGYYNPQPPNSPFIQS